MENSVIILEQYMYDSLKGMAQMRLESISWEGIPLRWNEETSRLESIDGKLRFEPPLTNSQT